MQLGCQQKSKFGRFLEGKQIFDLNFLTTNITNFIIISSLSSELALLPEGEQRKSTLSRDFASKCTLGGILGARLINLQNLEDAIIQHKVWVNKFRSNSLLAYQKLGHNTRSRNTLLESTL